MEAARVLDPEPTVTALPASRRRQYELLAACRRIGGCEPRIRREGIEWTGGLGGAPLALCLTFENPTPVRTMPVNARVRIATFGAFLPWRSLTVVRVPSIAPGGRAVVTETVAAPAVTPEGRLRQRARLLRARLLRAPSSRTPAEHLASFFTGLAPQLLDVQGAALHLAINIDVRVGQQQPVERHFGRFACLRPGHVNLAMLKVGDGKQDIYTFTVAATEPDWGVRLGLRDFAWEEEELQEGVSAELTYDPVCMLVSTPADTERGSVAIGVARDSTGQRTTVEFEFERAGSAP